MENRLIFFASAAEAQSETAEISPAETGANNLKNAAKEAANLENLKAKPGGTEKTRQAKSLIEGGKISDKAAEILQNQIAAVETAVAKRKNNLNPETTKALDTANAKLAKTVEKQKSRLAGNAAADSKMDRLAGLSRADEIFREVKISVNDREFKWKKGEMANFRLLPLEGKKDFLAEMEKALLEKPDAILATLEKFSHDSRIPKKWQEYCKTPEKWGHTKKHAAEWLLENADKKILQSETVFSFLEKNSLVLEKAGVTKPSPDEVFEKSTSEINQFIDGVKSKIAKVDAEQAEYFEDLKVSEGAKIVTAETKTDGLKNEEKELQNLEDKKLGELKKKIEDSPLRVRLQKKIGEAQKKAEKDPGAGGSRQEQLEKKSGGVLKKMGNVIFARFGKNTPETNQEKDEQDSPEKEEELNQVTTGVIEEMTDAQKNEKGEGTLSNQDLSELKSIFALNDLLDKSETKEALRIVALDAKNLTVENLRSTSKKPENSWLKSKTDCLKKAA